MTRTFIAFPYSLAFLSLACAEVSAPAEETTNVALLRAEASVARAAARAGADAERPIYHFHPPGNWMNDPNGPIYHQGYFHLFYQHNPYGDRWGHMHWGHARSADLVRWEYLPIALWPSEELGEEHCFSGCATVNSRGQPMIFYTSIARGRSAGDHAEQWAALGDQDLRVWRKHPGNPVLSEKAHGDLKVYDWRDPFLFEDQGVTYLVLGGNLNRAQGGQAVVNLYRAENADLTSWKFLGVLFRHPDPNVKNIECPNFFKLGDQWVLIISPHGPVEFFAGSFDPKTPRFEPAVRGILDSSDHFYAPNCLLDGRGRRILWGWVRGFKEGRGWNGCLTVPRLLESSSGVLLQKPAPELEQMRQSRTAWDGGTLSSTNHLLPLPGSAVEIRAAFAGAKAKRFGLRLIGPELSSPITTITFEGDQMAVGGTKAALKMIPGEPDLVLRAFLDKSLLEIFVNDRTCLTKVDHNLSKVSKLEVFAEEGQITVRGVEIWNLAP